MKKFIAIIWTLMALLFVGCYVDKEPLDTTMDEQAISDMSDARSKAFNEGNAARIAKHFTDDGILMPPGLKSKSGRIAVQKYYQAIFDQYDTELESGYLEIEVSGKLAYGRGYAKVRLTPKCGGETTTSEAEYINILKKQPNGSWKTTHDIWNSSN